MNTNDGLANALTGAGGGHDKAAAVYYTTGHLTDKVLLDAFEASSVGRKIVEIPAFDATRAWRAWQGEGVEISKIEAVEARLDLQRKTQAALISARLFGTAALYAADGRDPKLPLKGPIVGLRVLPKSMFTPGVLDADLSSATYGQPLSYQVDQTPVHPSRLAVFFGLERPEGGMNTTFGGVSVLAPAFEPLRAYDSALRNAAALLHEKNVSVLKIPELSEKLQAEGGESAISARLTTAKLGKGIHNLLVLSSEEEYEHHDVALGGVPETINTLMQSVSAAADIPVTRLFGKSPGGLNSTGESDIRNYYDRISSEQELRLWPALKGFDDLIIKEALNSRPDKLHFVSKPLWQESQSEVYANAVKITDALTKATDKDLLTVRAGSIALINALTEIGATPGLESLSSPKSPKSPTNEEDEGDEDEPVL